MKAIKLATQIISSPLGNIILCADDEALLVVEFETAQKPTQFSNKLQKFLAIENFQPMKQGNAITLKTKKQLKEYFKGIRKNFDIPLKIPGTEFQQLAWQGLRKISYGQTRSYKEQAQLIGRPSATRAVANANGKNRIAIIVPCHRIIAADGGLGGYTGGVHLKKKLLQVEGVFIN